MTHTYWGLSTLDIPGGYHWNGIRSLPVATSVENADTYAYWGVMASLLTGRWRISDWETQKYVQLPDTSRGTQR